MADCPWDLNGDGIVDDADWEIFLIAWGSKVGDENWNEACDFNGDGAVNILDAVLFDKNRGSCPSDSNIVTFNIQTGATLKVDGVEIV